MENVRQLKGENATLRGKLDVLQDKLQTRNYDSVSRAETDKIFKRIAQKTMDREKKVQLMYATPKDACDPAKGQGTYAGVDRADYD